MRLLATIVIQPHLSKGKKISPEKLLPFPWDKKPKRKEEEELTVEQRRERMKQLVERLGETL